MSGHKIPIALPLTFFIAEAEFEVVTRKTLEDTPLDQSSTVYDLKRHEILGSIRPPSPFVVETESGPRLRSIDQIRDYLVPESLPVLVRALLASADLGEGESIEYVARYECPGFVPFVLRNSIRPASWSPDGSVRIIATTLTIHPELRILEGSMPSA